MQPILGIHIYSDILSYKHTKASLSLKIFLKLFPKFLSKTHYAFPKNNTVGQQEKKNTWSVVFVAVFYQIQRKVLIINHKWKADAYLDVKSF